MELKPLLKKTTPHIIAILVMFIVASIYFQPAWEGKTLQRDDTVKSMGAARDKTQHIKYEKKSVLWLSTLFSGMPNFMGASYKSSDRLKRIYTFPAKLGIPAEVYLLMWYMIGFYILLLAFRVNPWLALVGAIAFGLTSYNLIIINAGHFKKVRTLAFVAPTLAGFLLTYRKKYLLGFVFIAFFLAQQIAHDHIQMSYYLLLGFICIGFVELFYHIKEKKILAFSKATAVIIVAAIVAIGPNYSKLSNLYRYNKQTIRGKSELTVGKEGVKTKSGLDRDYINSWSSGRSETMMLFAPKVKGGGSAYVKQDRNLLKKVDRQFRDSVGSMNQYWGNQPGSGGPNSASAVIIFLFILGLFLIKGPLKYGILISVILFIFLSWGRHFAVFTDLFIDYVPLYNKFRTPVSILAVAVIFISFFAFYTLSQIIKKPELLTRDSKIKIGKKNLPLYLAAGFSFIAFILLNIIFPTLFNSYLSDREIMMFDNYRAQGNSSQIDSIVNALVDLRINVFRTDFFRVLLLSLAALLSIMLFKSKKIKTNILIAIIAVLTIADVWMIGQSYVNSDDFTKQNLIEEEYKLSEIDKQIFSIEIKEHLGLDQKIETAYQKFQPKNNVEKEDIQKYVIQKNTFYRVYNLTTSSFNENKTSGSHRSIGGYSAAKLRRYQDLIEFHISKGNMQVLNMLNAKYFITQKGLQINREVTGSAWFVNSIKWAENPDEEIAALNDIDVKQQIVVNKKDKDFIGEFEPFTTSDFISIETHNPDYLVYNSSTSGNRLTVFSEIYYPDWTVLIDGEPIKYFTANYVLRAIVIPAGDHKIEFIFNPSYFSVANKISMVIYYLIMAMILTLTAYLVYSEFRKQPAIDKHK